MRVTRGHDQQGEITRQVKREEWGVVKDESLAVVEENS